VTRRQIALRYAGVALAASSWGTWPLILRRAEAIKPMPSALTSTIVMAVMTIAAAVLVVVERRRAPPPAQRPLRAWIGMAYLGVADAANFVLFFTAYKTTSVAIAVLTHYLAPIFVAIAAPLVVRERATPRTAVAVAVSFGGLLLLLEPWSAARRDGDFLGAALGAGSAVFYASQVLVNKRLSRVFSTSELICFHGVVGLPVLAAFVPRDAWGAIDPRAAAIIVAGAIGPGATAGLLFVWGLRALRASRVSTLTLLEPLVAVLAGVVAFGERLAAAAVVGAVLILAGAAAVVAERAE
jgi:drug/metabolite transporter (DMT)-like permease